MFKGMWVQMKWFLLMLVSAPVAVAQPVLHDFDITIHDGVERIEVTDTIHLPDGAGDYEFVLNKLFKVDRVFGGVATARLKTESSLYQEYPHGVTVYHLKAEQDSVKILYSSRMSQQEAATAGIVLAYPRQGEMANGVYIDQGAYWYPVFDSKQVTFSMRVKTPPEWQAISQGSLIKESMGERYREMVWQEKQPQRGVYLIAGDYSKYEQAAGHYKAQVFLRAPDDALADDFLSLTQKYIAMYEGLIGDYPYSKFALVESFWGSGLGMPSFTFIGPTVIRLPFIRYTSYPHEILHNWWGNSVYVDYQSGNWAEGLTSYLADYLLAEQRGRAVSHRREVLQKYADFIREDNDFALTSFTSGHAAQRQAVGYGKTLMLFHMLRMKLGDEQFLKALRRFYSEYQFKTAAYSDLEKVFSAESEQDLSAYFRQWVKRVGAPELALEGVDVSQQENGWLIKGVIKQGQDGEAYQLDVPIAVTVEGEQEAKYFSFVMKQKTQGFEFLVASKPKRLDVDPEFDLFRRLATEEIPAAMSQGFGAEEGVIVIPVKAKEVLQKAYLSLAHAWQRQGMQVEIVMDSELQGLPQDKAVWLLGWENRFLNNTTYMFSQYGAELAVNSVRLDKQQYRAGDNSLVMTGKNQKGNTIIWFASHEPDAIVRYARRLPHYRKYSYLAFDAEHNNILKGHWTISNSPMSRYLEPGEVLRVSYPSRAVLGEAP